MKVHFLVSSNDIDFLIRFHVDNGLRDSVTTIDRAIKVLPNDSDIVVILISKDSLCSTQLQCVVEMTFRNIDNSRIRKLSIDNWELPLGFSMLKNVKEFDIKTDLNNF